MPLVPHPICFLSLVVSSVVSFLISPRVSLCLSCLRCVFLVYFCPVPRWGDGAVIARFITVPVSPRRLVFPSRHASRAAAMLSCACLICSRWRSRLVRRLGWRGGERGVPGRFRNLFHGVFMYSESIAVLYRAIDIMGNMDMYMAGEVANEYKNRTLACLDKTSSKA